MNDRARGSFEYECCYGRIDNFVAPGPVPSDFTFNTPVGISMDKNGNVWVCDTGNGRVVIFDQDLGNVIQVLAGREKPLGPANAERFVLPFQLCDHPAENSMYMTDAGNGCVDVFSYTANGPSDSPADAPMDCYAKYCRSFGYEAQESFRPLHVPNGITIAREGDHHCVWVNDEFYHEESGGVSGRCVKFDPSGTCSSQFTSIHLTSSGKTHDLVWPQGLSSDKKGNLYLANTGYYEILKCHSSHPVDAQRCALMAEEGSVMLHSLGDPGGLGKLNVLRGVSVARNHIFVPDQAVNTISVYDMDGQLETTVAFKSPHWNSMKLDTRSLADLVYSFLEYWVLLDPYNICEGKGEDVYYITEPWINRLSKVRIKVRKQEESGAELLTAVGGRRDRDGLGGRASQFSAVASAIGMKKADDDAPPPPSPSLPFYLKYNPLQQGFMAWSKVVTGLYSPLYNLFFNQVTPFLNSKIESRQYHADAVNWTIKAYTETGEKDYEEVDDTFAGLSVPLGLNVPGNLAMAVYRPPKPLLGQICPGTPILFTTNFLWSMVFMYQFNMLGQLVNYGLPFGVPGRFSGLLGVGGLFGPMGIAVSPEGEIFIADAMNNRISKWQVLQTGQVLFRDTFRYFEYRKRQFAFTPSDVALDSKSRLFVCDHYNNAIRLFDKDGTPLWSYGKEGYCDDPANDNPENFQMPQSISIDNDHLVVSDVVNRVLKVYKIHTDKSEDCLEYVAGMKCFNIKPEEGLLWCPFFIYAARGRVYVPDSTLNVVNVYRYRGPKAE